MKGRVRLAVRRLLMRQPVLELHHVICPLLRPRCPCMEGVEP